jgi:hypothetical protein
MEIADIVKLGVPEEIAKEPMFKDVADVPSLFKVARDLNGIRGSSIRVPGPEASEADRAEFADKLKKHAPTLVDVPKGDNREEVIFKTAGLVPEKYEAPTEHGLPQPMLDALQAQAKKEGLTSGQFKRRLESVKAEYTATTQAMQAAQTALKSEYGAAYETKLTAAASAAKAQNMDPAIVEAIRTGTASPVVIKAFAVVAEATASGSGGLGDGPEGGPRSLTPAEINQRINECRRNPAWLDGTDPGHKALVQQVYEYNKQLLAVRK